MKRPFSFRIKTPASTTKPWHRYWMKSALKKRLSRWVRVVALPFYVLTGLKSAQRRMFSSGWKRDAELAHLRLYLELVRSTTNKPCIRYHVFLPQHEDRRFNFKNCIFSQIKWIDLSRFRVV